MNNLVKTTITAIEQALMPDEEGMVSAKHLYDFLELSGTNYSRWCKNNITDNLTLTENIDFKPFLPNEENPSGGRPTQDYKISISLAKELCILAKTETGKRAREFFVACEAGMKIMLPEIQKRDLAIQELKQGLSQLQNRIEDITEQFENRFRSLEGAEQLQTRWQKSVYDRIHEWREWRQPKLSWMNDDTELIEALVEAMEHEFKYDLSEFTQDYISQTGDVLPSKLAIIESFSFLKNAFEGKLREFITDGKII